MPFPDPRLIGCFARRTAWRNDRPHAKAVEEICSVSTCMSGCDWDWITEWCHHAVEVHVSPEIALEAVPGERRAGCDPCACRLLPARFVEVRREAPAIPTR